MARSVPLFLAALLLATSAHAQGWDDGNWSGEDELSAGAPASGYAAEDNPDYVADSGPSMGDFHQGLDEYGQWIDTPAYGVVWQPTSVDAGFRPYYAGRWVSTNLGWTWLGDEPFGWAVYHYGRWANLDGAGWVWLPGRVWGPAWVSWRWGGGYAGWAPLGPQAAVYSEPGYYVFVDTPHFLSPIPNYATPVTSVRVVYTRAVALPVSRPGPRAGPVAGAVAKATGQPVRALPVVDAAGPHATVAGGSLQLYRPRSVAIPVRVAQPARVRQSEPPRSAEEQEGPRAGTPTPRRGGSAEPAESATRGGYSEENRPGWGEPQPRAARRDQGGSQSRAEVAPQAQGQGGQQGGPGGPARAQGGQAQRGQVREPTQSGPHVQIPAPPPHAHQPAPPPAKK